MKTRARFLAAAAITGFALTSSPFMKKSFAADSKPDIETLTPKKFSVTMKAGYLLYLPGGYKAGARKQWPLILFLHGSGERGTNIWRATIHGPAKFIEKHPDFPFIVVTPQCPDGHKWSDEMALAILDEVSEKYSVDTNRIYLTGLSMGGYGAWSLATMFPERFAACAPICGGGSKIDLILTMSDKGRAAALRNLPVWAFHGGRDPVVPLSESQDMVAALKKLGNQDVKLTVYPEAQHDSWTQTYNNPDLYRWFLEHERKN